MFLLEPLDLNNNNWKASTCRETILVIAEGEGRARMLADLNFMIAVQTNPGDNMIASPWEQESLLVRCAQIGEANNDLQESICIVSRQ